MTRDFMNDLVKIEDSCRLCKSKNFKEVVNFHEIELANSLLTDERLNSIRAGKEKEFKANLSYSICEDCGLFFSNETISPEKLFLNYDYAASTSGNLLKYFQRYCYDVIHRFELTADSFVLVIASNDGVELKNFVEQGINCLGVEPSNLADIANSKGYPTIKRFFDRKVAEEILDSYGTPDLIMFNNVAAHTDLIPFFEALKLLVGPKTVFCLENSYHRNVVQDGLFSLLYHEHCMSLALNPLHNFLDKYGFEVFDFIKTIPHGGSFRMFCQVKNGPHKIENSVSINSQIEYSLRLGEYIGHKKFIEKIEYRAARVRMWVDKIKKEGKKICAWGWPAKAVLESKLFNFDGLFDYVVEDSVFKVRKYTPGTHFLILSSEYAKHDPPDIFVVMAWNFIDLIKKNNKWFKGEWVNPFEL